MVESTILETGIDQLASLIDQNSRLSIRDAASKLKTSKSLVEEWAKLLEQEGFLDIEYHFTNPCLVKRNISKEDVDSKIQEFHVKKDTFVRKGEIMISQLDEKGVKLSKLKEEFEELKKQHKRELAKIKVEVEELEKCKKEKEELRSEVYDQRKALLKEADYIKNKINKENENYRVFSDELSKEFKSLIKKKTSLKTFEKNEKELLDQIDDIKEKINEFNKEYKIKVMDVDDSEKRVEKMQDVLKDMAERIDKEKDELVSITKSSLEKEKEVAKMEEKVVKELQKQRDRLIEDTDEGEETFKKFQRFFKKRSRIEKFLEKTLLDRKELESAYEDLITKAKALSILSKSSRLKKDVFANEIAELEKNFNKVDKKRGFFYKEVQAFLSLIKKR